MKKTLFIALVILLVFLSGCSLDEPSTSTTIFSVNMTDLATHAELHQNSGSDEVSVTSLSGLLADDQHVLDAEVQALIDATKIDNLTAGDDNTDLDATSSQHGLLMKLSNNSTQYLNGTGNWTLPAGGGGDGDGSGHITILPWNYASIEQGSWVVSGVVTASLFAHSWRNVSVNDGDSIIYGVYLASGTYSVRLIYNGNPGSAILDIYIDADEIGSVDAYSASSTWNNFYTMTSINVTESGLKDIKLIIDGKNESSPSYAIYVISLALWRTE